MEASVTGLAPALSRPRRFSRMERVERGLPPLLHPERSVNEALTEGARYGARHERTALGRVFSHS
jgi:hypothetical protein